MGRPLSPNPVRRNLRSTKATVDATVAVQPKLTDAVPHPHKMTSYWWRVIWSSPISHEWVDADVPGLLELARLTDAFWRADPVELPKVHAALRMASQQFGLSPYSRRQLQWEVRRVEGEQQLARARAKRSTRSGLSVLEGTA